MKKYIGTKQIEAEPMTRGDAWGKHLPVSYTHLRAHETDSYLVCRLLLEKKKKTNKDNNEL